MDNIFNSEIDDMFDEEEDEIVRAEREAILAEAAEAEQKQVEKQEVDLFMQKMEKAAKLVKEQGRFVGLCEFCLGSDKLIQYTEEGYEGIQYKIDNDVPMFFLCTHGEDRTNTFGF